MVGLKVHSAKNQNQLNMLYNSVLCAVPVLCKKQGSLLAKNGQYCDRIGGNVTVSEFPHLALLLCRAPFKEESGLLMLMYLQATEVLDCNHDIFKSQFCSTRPKPPYGRQGLAGSWVNIQYVVIIFGKSRKPRKWTFFVA